MDNMKRNTLLVLKDLLRICQDEMSLFQTASDKSNDINIKSVFANYANKKGENILMLKKEIRRLGGNPDPVKIKKDLVENNYKEGFSFSSTEIIEQCIRTDVISLQRYSEAIKKDILWEVIPFVARQYFGSKEMHNQMINSISVWRNHSLSGVA